MIQKWHKKTYIKTKDFLRVYWKKILLVSVVTVSVATMVAQVTYPANKLLPYESIDNLAFGGWVKPEVTRALDAKYAAQPVNIYFGPNKAAYRSPKPYQIGIVSSNDERVNELAYPWYLRIVPGSLWWAHLTTRVDPKPTYTRNSADVATYIEKELGGSCSVLPTNASLEVKDMVLKVIPSAPGGTCKLEDVTSTLLSVDVVITSKVNTTVPVEIIPAKINDTDADNLKTAITTRLGEGVSVTVGTEKVMIPKDQLLSWIEFTNAETLDYSFSAAKASEYLNKQLAAKVSVPAGVTKVATYDFVETSRVNGSNGQTLDIPGTLDQIKQYIATKNDQAVVATSVVGPRIEYTRTYSPTDVGLSALMKNYAESRPGKYGVALTELSGRNRRAGYGESTPFTTASTYKLFVAYATLTRIESGAWKWSDQISGGRDLTKCLDDMIVVSDNACGDALLKKIGYTTITNEMRAAGLKGTSFLGNDGIKTTASDLTLLLSMLQTGQILNQQSSRDTLINALKRNIYRQGIPRGVSGAVANKVGFLDALLNDAGIVYASSGIYVLSIMTEGASWANIAELTKQIEALRIQ